MSVLPAPVRASKPAAGPSPPSADLSPLRDLQRAAHHAASCVSAATAGRVIVLDQAGVKVVELAVPPLDQLPEPPDPEPPGRSHGWIITQQAAFLGGEKVAVSRSRLKLLDVLVKADEPLTAKELTDAAFDRYQSHNNTRYHIAKLREELSAALGVENPIAGTEEGYEFTVWSRPPRGWAVVPGGVTLDGELVPIGRQKLALLRLLVEAGGNPLTTDGLRPAWDGVVVEESTIRWTVCELRKSLLEILPPGSADPIETTGTGYRLAEIAISAEVEPVALPLRSR